MPTPVRTHPPQAHRVKRLICPHISAKFLWQTYFHLVEACMVLLVLLVLPTLHLGNNNACQGTVSGITGLEHYNPLFY